MLEAMREITLLHLNTEFETTGLEMSAIRAQYGQQLAPLLVEAAEKIPRVYLLQAMPDQPGVVKMWVENLDESKRRRLPFNKPSGSQSSALGPVFKRTSKPKENPPYGPSLKIQNTTATEFLSQANSEAIWNDYFKEVYAILFQGTALAFNDVLYSIGPEAKDSHILAAALRLISEKETVFLSVVDATERWPGDRYEYQAYLAQSLATIKYITGEAQPHGPANCPLCNATGVTLYPNLRGTGINFSNMDRVGAFPNLDVSQAWKGYGLCLDCADLLYVFKNHVLKKFFGTVAGDKALLLPDLLGNDAGKQLFIKDWYKHLEHINKGVGDNIRSHEEDLLEFVKDRNDSQVVVHILWATFGQVVDEVRGIITDVLPSRLRQIAKYNAQANDWQHPLAPQHKMEDAKFDLSLNMLKALLKRPGGKKAEKVNNSSQLFAIKCQLVESIYHGKELDKTQITLWRELLITARYYLDEIANSGNFWNLLNEGYNEKKHTQYWTLAGWIRHLACFIHYLDLTGVLPMTSSNEYFVFEPTLPALKPYFQTGSGLNSPEKTFTFMLGILYGKVLQVQGARGVNVASNALTWLKRLNLDGRDLPELYCKIRAKALIYKMERSEEVRAVVKDLGRLGGQNLGDNINLDQTATCYFLLLGQSVAVDVLPSKPESDED